MSRPNIISGSFKTTTIAISQLFRDIYVYNYDDTGKPILKIPVHVSLDTKESIYEYLKYSGSNKKIKEKDTMLPRIGIQISSMSPALDRQTGKNQTRVLFKSFNSDIESVRRVEKLKKDLQPVPFNIGYTVTVFCKYIDHWAQIMENLLPFFDPSCNVGVRERELGIERQILVRLESVTPTMSFEVGSGNGQRVIKGEMEFTCETVLYKVMNDKVEGIINNIWLWTIDIDTPFASTTTHISGGPTTDIPATSGAPISGSEE